MFRFLCLLSYQSLVLTAPRGWAAILCKYVASRGSFFYSIICKIGTCVALDTDTIVTNLDYEGSWSRSEKEGRMMEMSFRLANYSVTTSSS